jgi:hypothetical protein
MAPIRLGLRATCRRERRRGPSSAAVRSPRARTFPTMRCRRGGQELHVAAERRVLLAVNHRSLPSPRTPVRRSDPMSVPCSAHGHARGTGAGPAPPGETAPAPGSAGASRPPRTSHHLAFRPPVHRPIFLTDRAAEDTPPPWARPCWTATVPRGVEPATLPVRRPRRATSCRGRSGGSR